MSESSPLVSIVIPCYNEAGNIDELFLQLEPVLAELNDYEVILVDDGSTDETVETIEGLRAANDRIKLIVLSRNFGHQAALKAGLDFAEGDCVISMDADLQHPPSLIPELVRKWNEGFEVVFTQREEDEHLSFVKRQTSKFFYVTSAKLTDITIHPGTADFRLLDRKVVDILKEMEESFLFYRGLVSWVGFRQVAVKYRPNQRFAGASKYTYRKMLSLALSGVTSFSTRPLRLSIILGLVIASFAGLYGAYVIYAFAFTEKALPGWTSTTASVLFIGGVQLVMLGVIGEYVGKGFIEGKRRPLYVIRDKQL